MKVSLWLVVVFVVAVYYYSRQETLRRVQETQSIFNRAKQDAEAAAAATAAGAVTDAAAALGIRPMMAECPTGTFASMGKGVVKCIPL